MNAKTLWIAIACISIVLLAHIFTQQNQDNYSKITISGTGTMSVVPDMAQLTVSLFQVAPTTKKAQEEVSKKTRQVLDILKKHKIEDKNISTASLNFRSEWDYKNNGRVLLGQRAEQRLNISVEGIKEDSELLSRIIDAMIEINGIELENIYFTVKNNTEFFVKSRELAYTKAMDKIKQYAQLAGLKIVKITNIAEEGNQSFSPYAFGGAMNRQMFTNEALTSKADGDMSVLPTGEFEITTRLMLEAVLK